MSNAQSLARNKADSFAELGRNLLASFQEFKEKGDYRDEMTALQ